MFESVKLVEIRLSNVVVQVASPKDVFGGGSCIFARLAFALVVFNETSGEQTVQRSDASADDNLRNTNLDSDISQIEKPRTVSSSGSFDLQKLSRINKRKLNIQ